MCACIYVVVLYKWQRTIHTKIRPKDLSMKSVYLFSLLFHLFFYFYVPEQQQMLKEYTNRKFFFGTHRTQIIYIIYLKCYCRTGTILRCYFFNGLWWWYWCWCCCCRRRHIILNCFKKNTFFSLPLHKYTPLPPPSCVPKQRLMDSI